MQLLVYSLILVRLLVWLAVCVGADTEEDFLLGYIPLTGSKHETRFVKLMFHFRATEPIEQHI